MSARLLYLSDKVKESELLAVIKLNLRTLVGLKCKQ